jgi:orotate phosphoribosyltransferase-like protein
MHDAKTVQRFIELRVQGRSLARIAQELRVSKSTRREGLDGVDGGAGSESCRPFPPTT